MCTRLRSVLLGDGLYSICKFSFEQSGLEEITIPCEVEVIGTCAFQSCKSLRKVNFAGSGLEIIWDNAFTCSGL